jgi:hypothetical protein
MIPEIAYMDRRLPLKCILADYIILEGMHVICGRGSPIRGIH